MGSVFYWLEKNQENDRVNIIILLIVPKIANIGSWKSKIQFDLTIQMEPA